jgi:hypothetical protein
MQLIFLAYLFRFYSLSIFKINSENYASAMNDCPVLILEHFQSQFLETTEVDGEKQYFLIDS